MISELKKMWKKSIVFKQIDRAENKHYQKGLTNTDFTVLCPNCIGGLVYHRLGEKFNSPTIDLTINTPEFCSFLEHLDYYLQQTVVEDKPLPNGTPSGMLKGNGTDIPDIHIYFTHYKDFKTAAVKWEMRKTRIKRENTYVFMYDIGDMTQEDYNLSGYLDDESLKKFENFECNNKVLFTRNPDCKSRYAHYIKPNYKGPFPLVYLNRNLIGLMPFETKFDFVSFINQQ